MGLFDEEFLKKIEYLYVVSKKVFTGKLRAERKTRKVASGMEFADHRNYAPGDDFRSLDWRVYGRTEKLLIESDRPLSWDLDGEFGGECDRAEISAQKKAMLIAAPTADSAAPDYIP